jgi:Cu+-exporting ATPase
MAESHFVDPVCGMSLKPGATEWHTGYKGGNFYFCSAGCKAKFELNPEAFLTKKSNPPVASGEEFTCPMHPEVRQAGPGVCPICGMALEPVNVSRGADDPSEYRAMLKRFWVSAVLSAPLLLISMFLLPLLPAAV